MTNETFRVLQTIGENIREQRKRLGLTQENITEIVKLSPQTLSAIENGRQSAHLRTYLKIANALSVPVDMFFLNPRQKSDTFEIELLSLAADCSVDEKLALLRIMREIKFLMH